MLCNGETRRPRWLPRSATKRKLKAHLNLLKTLKKLKTPRNMWMRRNWKN
jgi:hypothetical protein